MTGSIALFLGLLAFAHGHALADSATRTSAFEYDPATGLLTKEIIEPDNPQLCLATAYQYDGYGNKVSATTSNCAGASGSALFTSRTSSTSYAATTANPVAGQFAGSSTNALGQSETKEFDAKFGAVVKLTGPNGLVTTWTYDGFGRKTGESRADGTSTAWSYTICGTCPTGGKYFVTETSTGAPVKKAYYDALNREMRSEVAGFDGTMVAKDTEYDALGRVFRASKPYLAGGAVYWATFTYDILGRVVTQTEPNGAATSVVYGGLSTTTTNALGQAETRLKNSQGQLIRVTRQ